MAPLFSKADLNKLCHDVQNEVTLICAKCGKHLFNISKVIGRKTKWPRFFGLPCTRKPGCRRETEQCYLPQPYSIWNFRMILLEQIVAYLPPS